MDDLERASDICRGGRGAEDDKELPTVLLALLYDTRLTVCEVSGDMAAVDDVLRLGMMLLGRTKGEEHAFMLAAHADAYCLRFQRSESPADRDDAIEYRRRAQDAYESGPEWPKVTLELHQQLMQRWETEERPEDLDELIEIASALVEKHAGDELVFYLRLLTRHLWVRVNRTISAEDMDAMIDALRNLVRLIDPSDGQDLSRLCYLLSLRYRRSHAVSDLDDAVTAGRASLEVPVSDVRQMHVRLSNLYNALGSLAASTGSAAAYNEAVEVAERAVGLFPEGSTDAAGPLTNLSTALWVRFRALGDSADLDRSISYGLTTFETPGLDDMERRQIGATAIVGLTLKFRRSGDEATLQQALAVIERGVDGSAAWVRSLQGLMSAVAHHIELASGRESRAGEDPQRIRRHSSRFTRLCSGSTNAL
ncbi:hypothetical protein WKI71_43710 [Streptomyces sp. MS1.AVA.1]|uniref:Tetratricopeptide repeat protein n=1 Tax=Streptomyces machairae TaxID=3134109 RepID=A0ABU8UV23_9ACTN